MGTAVGRKLNSFRRLREAPAMLVLADFSEEFLGSKSTRSGLMVVAMIADSRGFY
jgi:hypothetical protein